MPRKYGTKYFGGLNTKAAPHLIEDGDLQACQNADFSEAGAVSPLAQDSAYLTATGDAQGLSAVQRNGSAEVWSRIGGTTYRNTSSVSGLTSTATMRVLSDGRKAYIIDGDANKVYEDKGSTPVIRPHGAFAPSDTKYNEVIIARSSSGNKVITNITQASPCVVTTVGAHGLSVGDYVGIDDGVGGMTEIAGRAFKVNGVPASNQIELGDPDTGADIDSTGYSAYTSGGSVVDHPCMLDGDYVFAVTYRVRSTSGDFDEIESSLYKLPDANVYASKQYVVTLKPWYSVQPAVNKVPQSDLDAYIDPAYSPTLEARFWRTKAGGSTFYYTGQTLDPIGPSGGVTYWESTKDSDLGEAWLYDEDANGQPPSGNLACIVQQRMYMAGVSDNETKLYFSRIAGYDYFKPTDYIDVEDRITALAQIGDRVAVFTEGKIGVYAPIDEIGQFAWTYSPVGTDLPDSVVAIEGGVLFARSDGLWLFDGQTSVRLTEQIEDDWAAINGQWSVAATPKKIVCTNSNGTFVGSRIGDKVLWAKLDSSAGSFVAASPDDVTLYALYEGASSTTLYTMFTGASDRTLSLTTKDFGGGAVWDALMLMVDAAAGGNDFTATVTSNFGTSETIGFTGKSSRFRYVAMLPRGLRGEFFNVKVDGQVTLYGVELTAR